MGFSWRDFEDEGVAALKTVVLHSISSDGAMALRHAKNGCMKWDEFKKVELYSLFCLAEQLKP